MMIALIFMLHLQMATTVRAVENNELADYVIDGMRESRAKLHSCQVDVQIKHTRTIDRSDSDKRLAKVSIAQDFDKHFMRFDRIEGMKTETREIMLQANYVRKPDVALLYVLDDGHTDGTMTKMLPTEEPPWSVRPFDVRCMGLIEIRGEPEIISFEDSLRRLKAGVQSCERIDGNRIRLILQTPNGRVKQILVIDESKGMAPISLEAGMTGSEFVLSRGSSIWEEKGAGIWVPTRCTIQGLEDRGISAEYELDWKSVNTPIPAKVFDASDLALPVGTAIVDVRSGVPKIESVVGMSPPINATWWSTKKLMLIFSPLPIVIALLMLNAASWRFSLRTLLIATTLVAVGLGLIVWAAR